MKSIKLLVLSLCGLFSMSSCVNDFLDRDPMDIISEDLVWSNENAVNAYNTLKEWGMQISLGSVTSTPGVPTSVTN